jgi:hypothetical protein
MRFKNFSAESITFDAGCQLWHYPEHEGNLIRLAFVGLVEPGEVTSEFEPDDPLVQMMLRAHPELRPYVTRTVWERILKPEL